MASGMECSSRGCFASTARLHPIAIPPQPARSSATAPCELRVFQYMELRDPRGSGYPGAQPGCSFLTRRVLLGCSSPAAACCSSFSVNRTSYALVSAWMTFRPATATGKPPH